MKLWVCIVIYMEFQPLAVSLTRITVPLRKVALEHTQSVDLNLPEPRATIPPSLLNSMNKEKRFIATGGTNPKIKFSLKNGPMN